MSLKESGEMYLETIYTLTQKLGAVRSIDVAENMGYSKPSVSRGMGILKKEGYIEVNGDGYIVLTETGLEKAKGVFERHTVLSRALELLGVDRETAAEDACRIEHIISEKTFNLIKKHIAKFN